MDADAAADAALKTLKASGVLLLTDASAPSLASLVAGGPVAGSWWGHPKGGVIFNAANLLEDHADVLALKLVAGKVTFVHRRLWPALLGAALSRRPRRTKGLTASARALLRRVDEYGAVRLDALAGPGRKLGADLKKAAAELERRLLVLCSTQHTETGAHYRRLERWERWAAARRVEALTARAGEREIAAVVAKACGPRAAAALPWSAEAA